LQYGALHDLVRVANQGAPSLGTPLDRELNSLRNGHFRQALQQSLPFNGIWLRFRRGFGKRRFVDMSLAQKFMQQVFLLGGNRSCIHERDRQSGGLADAP